MAILSFIWQKIGKMLLVVNYFIDYDRKARKARQKILNIGGGTNGLMGGVPLPYLIAL